MSDQTSAEQDYTMGYSEEFLQLLHRRSAKTHAAHLLPHLKPGLRVLDFGCGPGTISVGLATAVAPGELHGIDMEESQINMARAAAKAGGHGNATFHVGDVTDLPFDDNSFDVAHCHAVLMHVPDTEATLAEVKRVLKPGGIISSREFILGSSFLEPGGRGDRARMGRVREPSHSQWRPPSDGQGAKAHSPRSRLHGCPRVRFLRLLRLSPRRRVPPRLHHGLVLFAPSHSRGHQVRTGHERAIRRVERWARRVEKSPRRSRCVRLRRSHRHQTIAGVLQVN